MEDISPSPPLRTGKDDTTSISIIEEPVFTIKSYDAASLRLQPWLPELTHMINNSFIQHAAPLLPQRGYRLDTSTQLADEILKGGVTTVGFLEETIPIIDAKGEDTGRKDVVKKVVATATAKPWIEEWPWEEGTAEGEVPRVRRKILKGDGKRERDVWEWEMTAVVSRYEARYLGKGYATRVMKVLEADLMKRLGDANDECEKSESESGNEGEKRKRVWKIRNAEELTGEYWLSQGFKTVGGMWFEKGDLGCYRRFRLNHMVRDFGVGSGPKF